MQSNFHPNISNSYSLGKNGKALSKNKQKIQFYKKKRLKGTCFTCDSSEHQNAQCPVKKILKALKHSNGSSNKKEELMNQKIIHQPPCRINNSQEQFRPNGQCKYISKSVVVTIALKSGEKYNAIKPLLSAD